MTDKIEKLEKELQAAEDEIQNNFKLGKMPRGDSYAVIDRIKKELKIARRVKTREERRTDPKKTSRFSILLPDEELQILINNAKDRDLVFSQYIRHLLKIGLKVEEEAKNKG